MRFFITCLAALLIITITGCSDEQNKNKVEKTIQTKMLGSTRFYVPSSPMSTEALSVGVIIDKNEVLIAKTSLTTHKDIYQASSTIGKISVLTTYNIYQWADKNVKEAMRFKDHFIVVEVAYLGKYRASDSEVIGYKALPMTDFVSYATNHK